VRPPWRLCAPALGLLAACGEPIRVPFVEGTGTAILVVEAAGTVRAYAQDPDAPGDAVRVPIGSETDRLTALLLPRPPSALQLEPGELALALDPDLGRPLPRGAAIFEASAATGLEAWTRTGTPSAAVRALRIPREDLESCAGRGGCVADRGEGICLPCDEPSPVRAPSFDDEPTPPQLGACPWRRRALAGTVSPVRTTTVCDPEPERGPLTCPGALALPGADRCAAVGRPCAGRWPDAPDDAIFVDAAAAAPGDGTRGAPFSTLAQALSAARSGATIALGPGEYAVGAALPDRVALRGACAGGTRLMGSLEVPGSLSLGELTLAGSATVGGALSMDAVRVGGDMSAAGPSLTVRGSAVDGALRVARGEVTIHGSELAGALTVGSAVSATVSDARLRGDVSAGPGARLALSRVVVGGALSGDGASMRARDAQLLGPTRARGGRLELSRVFAAAPLGVEGAARAEVVDSVFQVTLERPGAAVNVGPRAELHLARDVLVGAGLSQAPDTAVSAVDLAIVSIAGGSPGVLSTGGPLVLERVLVEDVAGAGMNLSGEGGEVHLRDVRFTRCGDALRLSSERPTTLERAVIAQSRGRGVAVGDNGFAPALTLRDVHVAGVERAVCSDLNCTIAGLSLRGGSMFGERVWVSGSVGSGLFIGAPNLTLVDARVEDSAVAITLATRRFDLAQVLGAVRYARNGLFIVRP
jgi:hypothetical protein